MNGQSQTEQAAGNAIADDATKLLDLVAEVTRELHPNDPTFTAPSLDSLLDHDLALDSLGRIELLARVEAAFRVRLPESALADAESPRDILRLLVKASGQSRQSHAVETVEVSSSFAAAAPAAAGTLAEVLAWHVAQHGDRAHIQLFDDYTEGEVISYQRLWDSALLLAGGLQAHGLEPGEPVALMLPTGRDYFFAFFAVVLAGAIPVPIYPPVRRTQLEDHLRRQSGILKNCRAVMLITTDDANLVARLLSAQVDSLRHVTTVAALRERAQGGEVAPRQSDDLAFLQYTSGSTGDPKGVMLTHANLLANIRGDGYAMAATFEDVFVSWLPLYHDMGLIGAWLGSLYHAPKLVIMSPLSFLSRPERWFWAIHRYHGSLSAAPNFAFDLCVRRIEEKQIEGLDLSSWRVVANGAEAIRPQTIDAFCEKFAPYGFRRDAMLPVYGLAECSVGLCFSPLGRGPLIDRVDRDRLTHDLHAQTSTHDEALSIVGCGFPLPQHEIRVVDDAARELSERHVGRLQFRGPSACAGYFRNAAQSEKLVRDGWWESGDLAYIAGGELFITGRSKDLIIRGGRNIYPAELEHAIGELDGIRNGCVAVFGAVDGAGGTEQLVVIAESRRREPAQLERLRVAINETATEVVGAPPDRVKFVKPNTVLKTSSGKIRRAAMRALFESGELEHGDRPLWVQVARLALGGVLPQLRRATNGLKTFAYAVYAWLLIGLFGVAAWCFAVLPLKPEYSWRGVRVLARGLAWCSATPIIVESAPPPTGAPRVYVANHQSYLDAMLFTALLPEPVSFLAKSELAGPWYLRIPLTRLGVQFVDRFDQRAGVAQIEAATGVLARRSMLIFPEGTFKRMPGLLPFHMGAFTATVAADVELVPIALHGTRSMLRAGSWFVRHGSVRIAFGSATTAAAGQPAWAAALELRDAARQYILAHCREPDLAHESNVVETPSSGAA